MTSPFLNTGKLNSQWHLLKILPKLKDLASGKPDTLDEFNVRT